MPKSVHELARDMGDTMRLVKRMKAEEGRASEALLDEKVKRFFDQKGAPAGMEGAEYEELVDRYGEHASEIRRRLIAARLEGRPLTADDAHIELMREAGNEAGDRIDGMNAQTQKRAYDERIADEDWRDAAGEPPFKYGRKKRRPKTKAGVTFRYEISQSDALKHLDMIDEVNREKKK